MEWKLGGVRHSCNCYALSSSDEKKGKSLITLFIRTAGRPGSGYYGTTLLADRAESG